MKEQDWKFPEGRFLAYVLGPVEKGMEPMEAALLGAKADTYLARRGSR